MLEERLSELGSAIINYADREFIELVGFYSPEMLLFENETLDNKLSYGKYPFEDINYAKIKDDFILVIKENNKEVIRYKFKTLEKMELTFKDKKENIKSKIFRIRICEFNNLYNYIDSDSSILLKEYNDIIRYLNNEYDLISINRISI